MLYLIAGFLGIFAGLAAKGNISNIADFRLEKAYLVITAFLIQAAAQLLSTRGVLAVKENSLPIYFVVFILMAVGFWYNRKYAGILIICTGCVMNYVVMALNGGRMPVSPEMMEKAGLEHMIEAMKSGVDGKHILFSESTRLHWLADIIHPPSFLSIFMEIVSIGDLIVVLGIAVLMYEIVRGNRINRRYSNVKTD